MRIMKCLLAILFGLLTLSACSHFGRAIIALGDNPYANEEGQLQLGEKVYHSACARCHGDSGAGDGSDSSNIVAAMPNFTDGSYEKSLGMTAANITHGKREEMPAFKDLLSEQEIWAVSEYVKMLGTDAAK